jgi:hypothetical protein
MSYVPPHRRGRGGGSPASGRGGSKGGSDGNRRAVGLLGAMATLETETTYRNQQPPAPPRSVTDKYGRRSMAGTGSNGYSRSKPPSNGPFGDKDEAEMNIFNNAFAHVRCINLKRRTSQWERFLYHAARLGPQVGRLKDIAMIVRQLCLLDLISCASADLIH